MKSISTLLIALAVAFMFLGCANEQQEQGLGSASVTATVSALSVDEVDRIQVTVSGPNIAPDIVSELAKDDVTGEWSGLIEEIPAGTDRTFVAEAFDAAHVVIYSGTVTGVTVVDGEQVVVQIFLQQSTPPDPFMNTVPLFESLVVSSAEVAPGHSATLTVAVSDPDPGDVPELLWTATGGAFNVTNAPTVEWTAPSVEDFYLLTVAASDSTGATSTLTVTIDVRIYYGRGIASIQVDINTSPVAQNLVPTPTQIDVGEATQLDLTASDPDADALTYAWSANCSGTFSDTSIEDPSFTLDADNAGAPCYLTVALDDGRDGTNSASVAIATGPSITGECIAIESPELSCDDGVDNDCDGDVDALDLDCCVVSESPEVTCDDGVDNDCNGDADSQDSNCTTCADADGDGYGVGLGCIDVDCDDGASSCTTDCVTDDDADGVPACLDGCLDADGDNWGINASSRVVGSGADSVSQCFGSSCALRDPACIGSDCDDSDPAITDCSACVDADQDAFGEGPGCVLADCNDAASSCTTDCVTDVDADGVSDCIDLCIDHDGDDWGYLNTSSRYGTGADSVGSCTGCQYGDGPCAGEDCNDLDPAQRRWVVEEYQYQCGTETYVCGYNYWDCNPYDCDPYSCSCGWLCTDICYRTCYQTCSSPVECSRPRYCFGTRNVCVF